MLSAISYVVLTSGERPYKAINEHVNPVLGVGWITATIMANIIWCMPQFSLCFDILDKNLMPGVVQDTDPFKYGISVFLLVLAFAMVYLSFQGGWASKIFDIVLKLLIGMIVRKHLFHASSTLTFRAGKFGIVVIRLDVFLVIPGL